MKPTILLSVISLFFLFSCNKSAPRTLEEFCDGRKPGQDFARVAEYTEGRVSLIRCEKNSLIVYPVEECGWIWSAGSFEQNRPFEIKSLGGGEWQLVIIRGSYSFQVPGTGSGTSKARRNVEPEGNYCTFSEEHK